RQCGTPSRRALVGYARHRRRPRWQAARTDGSCLGRHAWQAHVREAPGVPSAEAQRAPGGSLRTMSTPGTPHRVAPFAFAGVLTLVAWVTTRTNNGPDAPPRWEVAILRGGRHIGNSAVPDWPPPLGACVDATFVVNDFPVNHATGQRASEVVVAFRHAGAAE